MKIIFVLAAFWLVNSCGEQKHLTRSANQIRIVRDTYGVPHIYADSIYALFYGYGYSIAQDRLFQMEMARRSTQGNVAEVFGSKYIAFDKTTRQLFDPASIRKQLKALGKKDRELFDGYAAGLNAWLVQIRRHPEKLTPKQFIDQDFTFSDWTGYDVAMIFIGTMNNRYGDFNTELENAFIYNALVSKHGNKDGRKLFDLLIPRYTANAPTTIPKHDWSNKTSDPLAITADIFSTKISSISSTQLVPKSPTTTGMSNAYVIGKNKVVGANSILVNGPQFGWYNPAYTYSFGMHGAGVDVVGNTPFGYPMIMFGHNQTIAWGSTWGASDIVDIFVEKLNPDNSEQYFYKGKYVDLKHRVELIKVRNGNDVKFDVYRSVHGPIVYTDPNKGAVYAKHRSWEGGELESLLAWYKATLAKDYDEWKIQAEKSSMNVNMYFADVEGNIGYFHGGKMPKRQTGHDNRLPVIGDGSMDWQGRQSINTANPHVLNPSTSILANWNNKPAQGVMNPDFHFYSWSRADRVDILNNELLSNRKFTADQAWSLLTISSYTDLIAPYLLPFINTAISDSNNPDLREANAILQRWNQQSRDEDHNGYYDEAATAIFRTFIDNLIVLVLKDDLSDAYPYFSASGYPTAQNPSASGTNIPVGIKAIIDALNGEASFDIFNGAPPSKIIITALSKSISQLTKQQSKSLQLLRLPIATRPYSTNNFLGIPQAKENERMVAPLEQNRGTENNMIVLIPNAIVAYEVAPPGQSGFISPEGIKSKHYSDQFDLYNSFGKKQVWFYANDIDENKESEVILSYGEER